MYIDFAQPFALPPYWLTHPDVVKSYDKDLPTQEEALSVPHACPLKIKLVTESTWWQFPIEPVITINSGNKIVRRNVLKSGYTDLDRRGSVKELWSREDYEISISGVFISTEEGLPEDEIRTLRSYCEARESIEVQSALLTLFNIRKISIEQYNFPFTKGMRNQLFVIKAYSDDFDEKNLLIAT